MTYVILLILAMVWAIYLASWLRTRTESTRTNSISSFSSHMNTLQRATPRTGLPVASRVRTFPGSTSFAPARSSASLAKQRRRNVLMALLGATGVTFLGSMVMGGMLTTLFALSLVLTGGYVFLLASAQKRVEERRVKVRHLPTAAVARDQRVDFFAEDRTGEVASEQYPHIHAVGSR